ncbi:NADH dehydrogenase [ubiquinone] 1 beta subcomplex subunit 9-like [Tachypleus tridentatus]|uniref:NADH dehydrogenase [ubiquinone] 1 beta subcomplex subunit 9-like n=1 Tax=Tachypleus tridentatus TaxID=6853 RepID=UPI003FD5B27C
MSYLETRLVSHTVKVCSLYKRALRNLESYIHERPHFRFNAVLLRQRFEENRNITDMRIAKQLIEQGEDELFHKSHYQPLKFPCSPGGVAYERVVGSPDWVLDYWHPLEKAQYPEYFARREQRKKEYIELWEKTYGKPEELPSH